MFPNVSRVKAGSSVPALAVENKNDENKRSEQSSAVKDAPVARLLPSKVSDFRAAIGSDSQSSVNMLGCDKSHESEAVADTNQAIWIDSAQKINNRSSDWYKNSIIFQVYPKTFRDSNQDGIGDIPGIIEGLDFVKSFHVDGLYVNPFYMTPPNSTDGGYDVTDHAAIDPVYGRMEDFEALVHQAHNRGLKVIIDQVWNHTSDQHAWFEASADPEHPEHNRYKDWYLWENPKIGADGERLVPNNWLSKFDNESAWTWCEKRGQYYFHNFLKTQPELNFRNPEVKEAILDIARFWMEKGVDGMRLDAVGFFYYDEQLRDNPWREDSSQLMDGVQYGTDYNKQHLKYNINQPESKAFMQEIRHLADQYGVALLAEVVCSENSMAEARSFIGDDKCHFAYTGKGLRYDKFTHKTANEYIDWLVNNFADSRLCLCYGNHDFPAAMTRFGGKDASLEFGIALASFFYSMPGSAILFQTDALGLPQAEIAPEDMKCPVGINLYPVHHGRDGTRTPIPWSSEGTNAGFTTEGVKPYLPVDPRHKRLSVDSQENQKNSYANTLRKFLKWRGAQEALLHGRLASVKTQEPVVSYLRKSEGQSILAMYNMSGDDQTLTVNDLNLSAELEPKYGFGATVEGNEVCLNKWGFVFFELRNAENEQTSVKSACFPRDTYDPEPFKVNPNIVYWDK